MDMRLEKVFTLTLIVLLTSGCMMSRYQAQKGIGDGYTEKKLSNQSYLVTFIGNSSTTSTHVQYYLYRRCAELTLKNEFTYFLLLDENSNKKTSLDYSEVWEEYEKNEEYTISARMFMANQSELTDAELRTAVDARVYLDENEF
jgi:hypothetical protein